MSRITGRKGEVYIPLSKGISMSNQRLQVDASKEIQGVTYTSRFYETSSRTSWNKGETISVRLQGIVGEATITPGTAVDSIDVSAFQYYDDNGTVNTATAATLTLSARDATGAQWASIWVANASGTVGYTLGTVSASTTTHSETWAALAGPAYISTVQTLIGLWKIAAGSATTTLASELLYSLPTAGTFVQERSDVPTFTVLPMEGGVLLTTALLGCHTGGAARTLYATFYDQYPIMAKIGDVDGWTLAGTNDTIMMEAQNDFSPETELSSSVKWSGTMSRFYVGDENIFATAMHRKTAIVRLYPTGDSTTKYYEGAIVIKSWGVDVSVGNAVKENISFDGDGNLELRGF